MAWVASILLVRSLSRVSSGGLAAISAVSYLIATAIAPGGLSFAGSNDYLVFTEAGAVAIAVLLALRVTASLGHFEQTVERLAAASIDPRVMDSDQARQAIDIEMMRARRHNRPLTVTVVRIDVGGIQPALEKSAREVHALISQRYAIAGVARLIVQKLRRTDIIVHDAVNSRFIILSPETQPHQFQGVAERLRALATDKLGVRIWLGSAGFPVTGLAFDDLVAHADAAARELSAVRIAARADGRDDVVQPALEPIRVDERIAIVERGIVAGEASAEAIPG